MLEITINYFMNKQIIHNFVDAINEHNVDKICTLMTDNHKFIDSQGNEVVGKEKNEGGMDRILSMVS